MMRFEKTPLVGRFYTKNANRFPPNVEYGDVIKGLPVPANSCQAIYCSHVLEHLSLEDCQKTIHNVFKLLQPGGTFRFVLPDLEFWAQKYLNDPSPEASKEFLREIQLGLEKKPEGLVKFFYEWLRTSAHLWMWDYRAMEAELKQAGFVDIRRATFNDSADPLFKLVERENRWLNCLGVECRKP
jgi:ubiquinone/menaquinone biosynthesis C-methylase UbiE